MYSSKCHLLTIIGNSRDSKKKIYTTPIIRTVRMLVLKSMHTYYNEPQFGGVIVVVLTSSVIYRGFELRLGQTKHCKIGICCFSSSITEKEYRLIGSELE